MAWTTPRTWVTGEVVTAAQLNTHVRDNLNWLNTGHGCLVYSSLATIVSPADAAETFLLWNSEDTDTDGFHSTVTNTSRLTVPAGMGGLYAVVATVIFSANATGSRRVRFRVNGATDRGQARAAGFGGAAAGVLHVTIMALAAADYVEVGALQSSGGALAINGGGVGDSTFGMFLIGA